MDRFRVRAIVFILIGLVIYAGLYFWSDYLIERNTEFNRLYAIQSSEINNYDFIILGASRANPLTYGDMQNRLEELIDGKLINLSFPGGGIVPNLFHYEYFNTRHTADNVVYVLSPFAFHSEMWNESRISDLDFYQRSLFCADLTSLYFNFFSRNLCNSIGTPIDYLSGFSKINNQDRFKKDIPAGEKNFDETFFHTEARDIERINYLYSEGLNSELFIGYLEQLKELISEVQAEDKDFIIIRPPLRDEFVDKLNDKFPELVEYEELILELVTENEIPYYDLTGVSNKNEFFIDPDHLNKEGVSDLIENHLANILIDYK